MVMQRIIKKCLGTWLESILLDELLNRDDCRDDCLCQEQVQDAFQLAHEKLQLHMVISWVLHDSTEKWVWMKIRVTI